MNSNTLNFYFGDAQDGNGRVHGLGEGKGRSGTFLQIPRIKFQVRQSGNKTTT